MKYKVKVMIEVTGEIIIDSDDVQDKDDVVKMIHMNYDPKEISDFNPFPRNNELCPVLLPDPVIQIHAITKSPEIMTRDIIEECYCPDMFNDLLWGLEQMTFSRNNYIESAKHAINISLSNAAMYYCNYSARSNKKMEPSLYKAMLIFSFFEDVLNDHYDSGEVIIEKTNKLIDHLFKMN